MSNPTRLEDIDAAWILTSIYDQDPRTRIRIALHTELGPKTDRITIGREMFLTVEEVLDVLRRRPSPPLAAEPAAEQGGDVSLDSLLKRDLGNPPKLLLDRARRIFARLRRHDPA